MSTDLYTLMSTVKLIDVVITLVLLIVLCGIALTQRKKIKGWLERWREKRNFEDNIIETINTLKTNDDNLQTNLDALWNTMKESREVSKSIREDMYGDIKSVSSDVKYLIEIINDIQEQEKLSKRANLKEKIERIYRECHEKQICTDIAFDTLLDLIKDYERNGGENSFVHSVVEPEMYTWERIQLTSTPAQNEDK